MKVRMINNEARTTDRGAGSEFPNVISANITIKVKAEMDEDIARYNDLIDAIEKAIDEATAEAKDPTQLVEEPKWE